MRYRQLGYTGLRVSELALGTMTFGGEVLTGRGDDIVFATMARFAMGTGQNDDGLSRGYLIRACEASLRRLKKDYIDLYQVHHRDGITPMEESHDALDTLVHQGKACTSASPIASPNDRQSSNL